MKVIFINMNYICLTTNVIYSASPLYGNKSGGLIWNKYQYQVATLPKNADVEAVTEAGARVA